MATDWSTHEKEHAVNAMIEIFRDTSDITLVCIGPLTNTALALKLEPAFAKWAKKVVIMGGNIHGKLTSTYIDTFCLNDGKCFLSFDG